MVRMTHWMGMLLLACTSAGCAQLGDHIDNTLHHLKCEHAAKTAWIKARDLYADVAFIYNFGEGFRDGYYAVCMGDDTGCAPPMPPRRYWSSCYLNCEGKAKAMAWFDGYAHGVLAASCSGSSGHSQVATGGSGSSEIGSALKGYRPPIRNPYGSGPNDGPQGYGGYGPDQYDSEPTPRELHLVPPPADDSLEYPFPGDDDGFAPEAPAEPGFPLEVWENRGAPQLPSAEAYRVPVF